MQSCAGAGLEPGIETVVAGGSGADGNAEAVDAAGERRAPVALETGTESTQRDAACGRVGPGRHTQGAIALAAPSHLGDVFRDEQKVQWEGPLAV